MRRAERSANHGFLSLEDVGKNFGGLRALDSITANVGQGIITALIGPNGAGKTTLFNIISGLIPITDGRVVFEGEVLTGLPATRVVQTGVGRTFQVPLLLEGLTVLENVLLGMFSRTKADFLRVGFNMPSAKQEEQKARQQAMESLDFVGLADRASVMATELPFGQQRLIEIARAIVMTPKIILLDEPAAGFDRAESESLMQLFVKIQKMGITLFLVDHDMNVIMNLAQKVIVLNHGAKIAEGTPSEVQKDPEVLAAYLGGD